MCGYTIHFIFHTHVKETNPDPDLDSHSFAKAAAIAQLSCLGYARASKPTCRSSHSKSWELAHSPSSRTNGKLRSTRSCSPMSITTLPYILALRSPLGAYVRIRISHSPSLSSTGLPVPAANRRAERDARRWRWAGLFFSQILLSRFVNPIMDAASFQSEAI
jgi:hypothetical protein